MECLIISLLQLLINGPSPWISLADIGDDDGDGGVTAKELATLHRSPVAVPVMSALNVTKR